MATGSLIIATIALLIAAAAVVGGVFELLKQRVIVDKETRQIVEIEIPLFGKVKSNYPSVAAIFLGAVIVWLVLDWATIERSKIPLTATVTFRGGESDARRTADVFVNAIPQRYKRTRTGIPVNAPTDIDMMVDSDESYDVMVFVPLRINEDGTTDRAVAYGPLKLNSGTGVYQAEIPLP